MVRSPCGSKVGFGLGPQDEVDARVTGLGSGDVLKQLAAGVRDQGSGLWTWSHISCVVRGGF